MVLVGHTAGGGWLQCTGLCELQLLFSLTSERNQGSAPRCLPGHGHPRRKNEVSGHRVERVQNTNVLPSPSPSPSPSPGKS